MLPVCARLDPKTSYNIQFYEEWEALDQPPLKKLYKDFTKSTLIVRQCIGSFIIKSIIQDQLRYVHFYVADKDRLQEGAINSTTWLPKSHTLYKPQTDKPS